MRQDVVKLQRFYERPLGQAAARIVAHRIETLWGGAEGLSVLGFGYAPPVLGHASNARRCVAAMPADQGAAAWSSAGRGGSSVKTDEDRLPFPDALFDRVIVYHGLEEAASPRALVRELWRVMAPEGRIIIAAANRRGLWSRAEATPFGHGRPWTRGQLGALLSESSFQTTASAHALHMPPVDFGLIVSAAEAWERAGELLFPAFGGVALIEAVKRLYINPRGSAAAPVLGAVKARKNAAGVPRNKAAP